jgi:hypothetical protein
MPNLKLKDEKGIDVGVLILTSKLRGIIIYRLGNTFFKNPGEFQRFNDFKIKFVPDRDEEGRLILIPYKF